MYDTLNIWLPAQSIAEVSMLNNTPNLFTNLTQHSKADSTFFSGHFEGLKASVSNSGLSLKGSLCKYYLNDNIKTLTRQDTQRAFEKLADTLHLPMSEAVISRIDLAQSFLVNYPAELYYPYLGESNYFKRLVQPSSLYYNNGLRVKLFYNKVAEAKKRRVLLPEIWQDKHVLRYELRYVSRLPQQFNINQVKAKTLFEERFYINLIERWKEEYDAIDKLNHSNINYNKMKKPKDFMNQMAAMYIKSIGQNEVLKLVEQMKANNCFEHKEYYSRLKRDIKKLSKIDEQSKNNELITELTKKIQQATQHYR
ncbi:MAG: phage/plasmid replication protein [Bacteroidota bacterium]|jgi:hypothetical protein